MVDAVFDGLADAKHHGGGGSHAELMAVRWTSSQSAVRHFRRAIL